jgi:hypothetical protein
MNTRRAESAHRDLEAARGQAGQGQDALGTLHEEKEKTLVMGKVFLHFVFHD